MYDIVIKNGILFDSEQGNFHAGDLCVQNGKIVMPLGEREEVWKRENETAYKSSAIHPALLFVCRKKQPAEHVKLSLNSFYAPLCSSLYCFKARAS